MRNRFLTCLIFAGLMLILSASCKKEAIKVVPTVTTTTVTNITANSATSGGEITFDGGAGVTARGVCWSTNQNPITADNKTTDGTGSGSFISSITGLTPGTTYYIRAYAINEVGTAYSSQTTFNALAMMPVLTTTQPYNVTTSSATSGGNITNDGGSPVITRGVCWNTSQNPTTANTKTVDGTGTGSYTSSITGLEPETTYFIRAYSNNSIGTSYGPLVSFTTSASTVNDIDGNVYNVITIGTQVWMVENLKTTKFNDGTGIPNVTNDREWSNLVSPGYCWYNLVNPLSSDYIWHIYNPANDIHTYGALYNWYAVNTGKLAPKGWHVPTDEEWTILTNYLEVNGYGYQGSGSDIGKSMAAISVWRTNTEAGTVGNNQSSNNSSGFTAFPAGYRIGHQNSDGGRYISIDAACYWWSSTKYGTQPTDTSYAWGRYMSYGYKILDRSGYGKAFGYSIRCVKDYGN